MIELKNKFLDSFKDLASIKGVNESTLLKVSEQIYGSQRGYVLDFYNGLFDVVEEIENYFDEQIKKTINIKDINSTTDKIRQALKARIYGDGNRKEIYKALSKFYLSRDGIGLLAKNSWRTVDFIWKLAGDKSLDWNYYSKRTILFTIYTTSRRHYIQRSEENFDKTEKKIDKALNGVKKYAIMNQKFKLKNIPVIRLFIK